MEKWKKLQLTEIVDLAKKNEKNCAYEIAFEMYTFAANKNNEKAQNNLAVMYYDGKGTKQNYEEALKWFKKAAEQGLSVAQCNLARMYQNGKGTKRNYQAAFKWYKKAAEQGLPEAQFCLALMYYDGNGTKQNYQEAFKWSKKAVKNKDPKHQYFLGVLYFQGIGVNKDIQKATKLFENSAKQGFVSSQCMLGKIYFIQKNYHLALECFTKCTNIDDKDIQGVSHYFIGIINYVGDAGTRNVQLAKQHFLKAIEYGYDCHDELEKCEYEIKSITMQNNILNTFDEKEQMFIKIFSQQDYIEKEMLKDVIGKIDKDSLIFIRTGIESYFYTHNQHKYRNIKSDFTSSITPLCKALENELKIHFLRDYMNYLVINIDADDLSNNKFLVFKNKYGDYEYFDVENRTSIFTLGKFKDVLGYKELRNLVLSSDNIQENMLILYDENNKPYSVSIEKSMLKYLKEELFDENKFNKCDFNREIMIFINELCKDVEWITSVFRNPAAHDTIMEEKSADQAFNLILFKKKLIINLLDKLKS